MGIDANLTGEVDARRYLAEPQLAYPLTWLGWTVPRVCIEHTDARGTWEAALRALVQRVSHSIKAGHDARRRYTILTLNVSGHKYFDPVTSDDSDWPSVVYEGTDDQGLGEESPKPNTNNFSSRYGSIQQLPCFGNVLRHCHPSVPPSIIECLFRTSEWRPADRRMAEGDPFAAARIAQRGKLIDWIQRDVEMQDAYGTVLAFQARQFTDSLSPKPNTPGILSSSRGGTIDNVTEANERRRRDFYAYLQRIASNGTKTLPSHRARERSPRAQDVSDDARGAAKSHYLTSSGVDRRNKTRRRCRMTTGRRNITLPTSSCANLSRLRSHDHPDVPFISLFISGQPRTLNRTLDSLLWAARGKASLWIFALITVDSGADPARRDLSDDEVKVEVAGWNRLMSFPGLLGVLVFDVQPVRERLIVNEFHRGRPYHVAPHDDVTRPDGSLLQWYVTFAGNTFRRMYESRCQLVAARKHQQRIAGRHSHRRGEPWMPVIPFRMDTPQETRPMQFDLSMRLRTDAVFLEPCPLANFWDGKLHIPEGLDYGGINDQWSLGEPRFHDVGMQSAFLVDQGVTQWKWLFHSETVFSQVLGIGSVMSHVVRDGCYGLLYKEMNKRFDYRWIPGYSSARITQDIESSRRNRSGGHVEDYPTFRRFRTLHSHELL